MQIMSANKKTQLSKHLHRIKRSTKQGSFIQSSRTELLSSKYKHDRI